MGVVLTPHSSVQLMRGIENISPSYSKTLDFTSLKAQTDYFSSKVFLTVDNVSYIRKNTSIRINENIEDIIACNYLRYQNNNKWYYCFVIDKVYINENCTELVVKTDVFQTYIFNVTLEPSYVLRDHSLPLDKSMLNEGFELGSEYEVKSKKTVFNKDTTAWLYVLTAPAEKKFAKNGKLDSDDNPLEVIDVRTEGKNAYFIQGVPTTLCYHASNSEGFQQMTLNFLQGSTCLVSALKINKLPTAGVREVAFPFINDQMGVSRIVLDCLVNIPEEVESNTVEPYKPSDDRFNVYPFTYSLLTDYINTPLCIKHEYAQGWNFKGKHAYSTEPTSRYYLYNYCNDSKGDMFNLTTSDIISAPLTNDKASEFLMQNKNQMKTAQQTTTGNGLMNGIMGLGMMAGGVASMIGSGGTLTPMSLGMIGGGAMTSLGAVFNAQQQTKQQISQMNDISSMPPSIVNMGRPSMEKAFSLDSVDLVTFSISDEIKKKIADYWKAFGYKQMRIKTPSFRYNSDMDYIQTQDLTIKTDVMTASDILELENIFNKGITIIHN